MTYRGPFSARHAVQMLTILSGAGYTATWRQYVSSSGGNPDLGLGDQFYYREQSVTALVGAVSGNRERQTVAGLIAADEVMVSLPIRLARRDELLWRGVTYRVENDPVRASIDGQWVAVMKRGE